MSKRSMNMKVPVAFCKLLVRNPRIFLHKNVGIAYSTARPYKPAELNAVSLKSNEKNYFRGVLLKCSECILYEPSRKLDVRDVITPKGGSVSKRPLPKHLLTDELVRKLANIARLGITPDPNVVKLLDRQCLNEYKTWPIEKRLFVLDLWHHVPETKQSNYLWAARGDLLGKIHCQSPDQALQTLYYVWWLRSRITKNQQNVLEKRFMHLIDSMTLETMSVWCLSMFRNDAHIKNRDLIEAIFAKLLENELEKFNDVGLGSVLKMLRVSSTGHQASLMKELLTKLRWHVQHSDLMLVSQIALVSSKWKIHDSDLLELIVTRMGEHVDRLRFKDLERICYMISMFDYKSNATTALLQKISQYLVAVEKDAYHDSIIRCIEYMQRCGCHEPKLIAWALDPKTISVTYREKEDWNRGVLLRIDMFAKINLAGEYRGPRLSDSDCATIIRQQLKEQEDDWNLLLQIESMLLATGRHCVIKNALPHHMIPDILLVIDTVKNATVDLASITTKQGQPIRATDLTRGEPHLKAIAIVLATTGKYLFGGNKYTGDFVYKLQQLAVLGYDSIVIPSKQWMASNDYKCEALLDERLAKHGLKTNE